jgi:hypothetical protein
MGSFDIGRGRSAVIDGRRGTGHSTARHRAKRKTADSSGDRRASRVRVSRSRWGERGDAKRDGGENGGKHLLHRGLRERRALPQGASDSELIFGRNSESKMNLEKVYNFSRDICKARISFNNFNGFGDALI